MKRRASLMITASTSGIGKPKISARKAKYAVLATALPNSGSASTLAKLSRPTNVGAETRFVSWTLMTSDRTIGNQEKTPKISSNGSRKTSVLSPSRLTQVAGHGACARRWPPPSVQPESSCLLRLPFCP